MRRLNDRQRDRVANMLMVISSLLWSVTPDFDTHLGSIARWAEIGAWISEFGIFASDKIMILDDEADMGPLSHLHVRTDSHTGLTPGSPRSWRGRSFHASTTTQPHQNHE